MKTVKRTQGNTAKRDLSAIVTEVQKWAEKKNGSTSLNISYKATLTFGAPVTSNTVLSTLAVIPRASANLSIATVAATGDFVHGQ